MKRTLKNLHPQNQKGRLLPFFLILSLQNFFRRVFSFRQAEQTKNEVKLLDLDQQLYPPNRQFFRSKYCSFSIWINA
ncbi:hypothetical protein ACQ3VC_31560, partial [Bacillus proteolyticus]|uniref:hypothetical protein n=1 Tax=Bacillus proteolyticus TaxID=2026192 RepID=UPI003D3018E1